MIKIKTFAIIGIAIMALCLLSACGEKKITVKGTDGTVYESYQDCCAALDFQAAHQFLAKMENSENEDYSSAMDYVFKQETLYLMSIGDETAKKRIIYLLKEEGGNDSHLDMVMDLAIDADDEDFVKALTKQYKGDISSNVLRKIVEFLYIEKGEGNLDFVQTLLNRYNQSELLLDAAVEKGNENLVVSLAESIDVRACDNILLKKLSQMNNKKLSNALIGSMVTLENCIPNRPPIGKVNVGFSDGDAEFQRNSNNYISGVKNYNDVCRKVLNAAISTNNIYLAKIVIPQFKSNIYYRRWDNPQDNYFWYIVSVDNNEINEAKATYNKAVRSGAFNK